MKTTSLFKLFSRAVSLLLLLLLINQQTFAWSKRGHVIITRTAVKLLIDDQNVSKDLKKILLEGLGNEETAEKKLKSLKDFAVFTSESFTLEPGLDLYSFRPDELANVNSAVPSFNSDESKMHYIDLELFNPDPKKRIFLIDGSAKVKPSYIPRNKKDKRYLEAGFVTFRTEECYKQLVRSFNKATTNEEIFLWLGYLSHYLSDSYQPYHSTIDYRGIDCPGNRERKYNFHFHMESTLFNDKRPEGQQLREDFWKEFETKLNTSATLIKKQKKIDPYLQVQHALLSGYDYLPMLCRAGDAAFEKGDFNPDAWFGYSEKVNGREMTVLQLKAARMAEATLVLKTIILQAWQQSGKQRSKR